MKEIKSEIMEIPKERMDHVKAMRKDKIIWYQLNQKDTLHHNSSMIVVNCISSFDDIDKNYS